MKLLPVRRRVITSAAMAIAFAGVSARADVIAVSTAAFPGGSALITFTGLADGVEVNGLVFGGVQFSYSLGPGQVVIDGGPVGNTNVTAPNIVSVPGGNPTGVLTLVLPSLQNLFGFGFAVLSGVPVANATTITLFNNATNVGALSYNGVLDPIFAGGFAGIQSTLAFNRAQVTFNPIASAFAVDNIRFANVSAVPEPATLALVFTGLVAIGLLRRRRPATSA
jgi:hypothetical protein